MNITFDELFYSKTRDFLDIYLPNQCNRSSHIVKGYRDALTIFRRFLTDKEISIKKFKFSDCTREFLLDFMEYLQSEGYEKSTCNQRLAAIKAYLWYVADGDIKHQQTALSVSRVPFLKKTEKEKEVLSDECLKALMALPGNTRIGIRDTTIMVLLYDTAIRLSELLSLKVTDLNLQRLTPYIRIHGKGDKERIVSISDNTVQHLKNYLEIYHKRRSVNTDYLFYTIIHNSANQMSPGNVARIIKKYADLLRNDFPEVPQKVHPHMFRRTRATNLYQSGVELELVSRILGHSSTQTTRIYAKPSVEMLKEAMENSSAAVEVEEPIWPDNEDELARIFGIR